MNKRKFSAYAVLVLVGFLQSVAFTNCGQAGTIALKTDGVSSLNNSNSTPQQDPPNSSDVKYTKVTDTLSVTADKAMVDILIVDDNSGSMALAQQNMGSRFPRFISEISKLDWQLGIVTTDMTSDADLKDGRLVALDPTGSSIDSSVSLYQNQIYQISSRMATSDADTIFRNSVRRTEKGSGDERGISAAKRALERSLDLTSDRVNLRNHNLIREGSTIAVIVISNDNEYAINGDRTKPATAPSDFLSFVKEKLPKNSVVWHSIVVKSGDEACLKMKNTSGVSLGNESYGSWYEELSKSTKGVVGSICDSDYSQILSDMGQSTLSKVSSINLKCNPVDINKDGVPDIEITDLTNKNLVNAFKVSGSSVVLDSPLNAGEYSVSYTCQVAP